MNAHPASRSGPLSEALSVGRMPESSGGHPSPHTETVAAVQYRFGPINSQTRCASLSSNNKCAIYRSLLISFVLGFMGNSALAQEVNPYEVMGKTGIAQTSTAELD